MNYINVHIDGDNYIFKTNKKVNEVLEYEGALTPTDEFRIWFEDQTDGFYDAESLGEMIVEYVTDRFVIEY